MKRVLLIFPLWASLSIPGLLCSQSPGPSFLSSSVTLTDDQWKNIINQFEESVETLSKQLENSKIEKKNQETQIETLKNKISQLRQSTQNGSNVFDDIRLKDYLSDLKDKLEKYSFLQHEWEEKQKEFEQKTLSLVSLYNEKIDHDLEVDAGSENSSFLNSRLKELAFLTQKRNRVQSLLKEYQKDDQPENSIPESSFGDLKTGDKESLQLTLDLIRDRKNELEEKIQKWSIEKSEIQNELNLQGKMQEFLDDVQKLNEDSNFPHGSLKRNDLEDMAGNKERHKLETRFNELQNSLKTGQISLDHLNQIFKTVQNQLDLLNKKGQK
jgi:chromosome segregation ATPase